VIHTQLVVDNAAEHKALWPRGGWGKEGPKVQNTDPWQWGPKGWGGGKGGGKKQGKLFSAKIFQNGVALV